MSLDRLSSLFRHVTLGIAENTSVKMPRLQITRVDEAFVVGFYRNEVESMSADCDIRLDFGSLDNPVLLALPGKLQLVFEPDNTGHPIAAMIVQETQHARCGSPAVLDRLIEVVLILLLRRAIELGQDMPGLLAGLSDDKLKFALVAVHENPGFAWSTEKLADLSHLSRTAFYQRFNKRMGVSPMNYVRSWRMSLAKAQLAQGARIPAVAYSLGYRSPEGFSRAFHQHYQRWPSDFKPDSAA